MNSKMITNSQLSTNEPKKKEEEKQQKQKLSKQLEQEQKRMDIMWRVFSEEGEEKNRGELVQGRRSTIGRHKIDRERSKTV